MSFPQRHTNPPAQPDPRCDSCNHNLATTATWCETAYQNDEALCEECCATQDACIHCSPATITHIAPVPSTAEHAEHPRSVALPTAQTADRGTFPDFAIGERVVYCAVCRDAYAENRTFPIVNVGDVCGRCVSVLADAS